MDLVFNKVVQLEHVGDPDGNRSIKLSAALAIAQRDLAVGWQACRLELSDDVLFRCTVEDWRCALQILLRERPAKMRLEQLAKVHATWHSEWVEDDVNGRAVW